MATARVAAAMARVWQPLLSDTASADRSRARMGVNESSLGRCVRRGAQAKDVEAQGQGRNRADRRQRRRRERHRVLSEAAGRPGDAARRSREPGEGAWRGWCGTPSVRKTDNRACSMAMGAARAWVVCLSKRLRCVRVGNAWIDRNVAW